MPAILIRAIVLILRGPVDWVRHRSGVDPLLKFLREHKVPAALNGRIGWMYVFGLAILGAFAVQVVSGIALATIYVPSAGLAHESVRYITEDVRLGGFLRGMHFFGASAMVVLVFVHMAQVFLAGAYKYPREMNWISGVLLMVLTMGMALTGQMLRWDSDGLWTVVVAAHFAERVPLLGEALAAFILGGSTVGGATLTRFYAAHVFLLPGLIIALVGFHLYLVLHHGISEPPKAGVPVDPATYESRYAAMKEQGIRYFPDAAWKEIVAAFVVVVSVILLAFVFGPKDPGVPPDPTIAFADPRPDWYLRWYYAFLYVKPRGLESLVMVYLPIAAIIGLILLPLVFRGGERSPSQRPLAVAAVGAVALVLATLTVMGFRVPWSPAYDTEPLGAAELGVESGPVLEGAAIFHARGCQYCHVVLGRGGQYGPDLTEVLARISPQEAAVRIVQGFGRDMPAYRDILSQEELDALIAFLDALPARRDEPGLRDGRRLRGEMDPK
jgi:ubiquinol-cytochrome c reductase cytochrome b subunit